MERIVPSHNGYELSTRLKMTALKMLMVGRAKDRYELWEDSMPKGSDEEDFKKLVGKVQDYATRKRR